ncbi:1215_t:CDS:1, partial [Dentiscutata erythropus]
NTMFFDKMTVRPSKDLKDEVERAMVNENLDKELMKVFNTCGHFLPRKIVIGHKLYRKSNLLANHENNNQIAIIQQAEWKNTE